MFTAGDTVTVIRPPARDRLGDPVGADTTHTIEGCALNQIDTTAADTRNDSSANGQRRNSVITRYELLCPAGADIRSGDHVQLPNGSKFRVDGEPWAPRSPFTGWAPGVIVRLRGVSDAA
ncbi:hypothetical protein [Nocardia cyriacigeorgica]|uniref:hypothetical protein n=1 Tax=Nocardia cyriacigeorgica TaxID=135487 RepID=UPI002453AC16|nr:hypothetical protein [Nocardia cyriacigeorgica]